MKKLIFILVLVCLATAIKKKAWDSCDTQCKDPTEGTHCDQECKDGVAFMKATIKGLTACGTHQADVDAAGADTHLDNNKLMACVNAIYAYEPKEEDWEKFENEAAWFWFGCKWEFCLEKLFDAEFGALSSFNEENIHRLPFTQLLEEDDEEEDAGGRRRRMARGGARKLELGKEAPSLTESQKAELAAEAEGNWGADEFSDAGEWDPDNDWSEIEAEEDGKGEGYDEHPSAEPDFDAGSMIGWYGCAASGPFNVCYNDADSAEVKRSDGSLAIRLCTADDIAYEDTLGPKTTIDKIIAALSEMEEALAKWEKDHGFSEGSGRRRALKISNAVHDKNTMLGRIRRKLEEDDHAGHDHAGEDHNDDDDLESYDEADYEKEFDNSDFEAEMEKIEAAFDALLKILAFPEIKVADFKDACEYAMVYTFRYPLAVVPQELVDCFTTMETAAAKSIFKEENSHLKECAKEAIAIAAATMHGTPEELGAEVNPNGTKLKLVQCVEGAPAPKCKTKKICAKGTKKISKCLTTGDDCSAATKWYESAKPDAAIPDSCVKCYKGCKAKAEAKGIKEWFLGLDACMNAYYGGLVTLSSPMKVDGATETATETSATAGGRFLAEATSTSAATDFAACQKKCVPKTCAKKLKAAECKVPVQDYENCLAKETSCKSLATWVNKDHKTKDYNPAWLKTCTDKCGAKSTHKANKFVKGAYQCLNNCGVKLNSTAKTLPSVSGNILHLASVLLAIIAFVTL